MTYSIVARDEATGDLGAAAQSHWFAAGTLCWAEPGVGAVATQAWALMSYGPLGLERMRAGRSPGEALAELLSADEGSEHRQVAMVDRTGAVAAHTGARCLREAGHRMGDGFSCQANMMVRSTVWDAMHDAYRSAEGDLPERLLVALEAAEAEGGDIRGRQAARVLVVRSDPSGEPWTDTLVDLRVDDHPAPLAELHRLLHLKRAYDRLEAAEDLELTGDLDGALRERIAAMGSAPASAEVAFWTALSLASADRVGEAREALRVAYEAHDGWRELLRRMADDGHLELDPEVVQQLLRPDRSTRP
ncbi:MAG TPA: DUF1028 domain-containing protein [Actinomycetota bacterium]|nr:DUF1028 domain-containing protein [Actinomycetota bacterium]